MSGRTLKDWLQQLEQLHPSEIELGLERVGEVAERLELKRLDPFVVTVAGTNGKGTTIAFLESVLANHGYRVGAYTSPHIHNYNERVRIIGQEVSDVDLCRSFEAVEGARQNTPLTYFEFGTLSALTLFKNAALDFILLEVGLGGRLDAVNIVEPDLCLLTSVGIDHVEWLGDSLESIAREKAGIARCGIPFVSGANSLPIVVANEIQERTSHFHGVDSFQIESYGITWNWRDNSEQSLQKELCDLPCPDIPIENAGLGLKALSFMPITVDSALLRVSLENLQVAGRMQWLGDNKLTKGGEPHLAEQGPLILLDVAHNAQAAEYLAGQLSQMLCEERRVVAIYSALSDKDVDAVVAAMMHVVDEWRIFPLDHPRAASLASMDSKLKQRSIKDVTRFDSGAEAFESIYADQFEAAAIYVVFGSFFTVATAQYCFSQSQTKASHSL